MFAFFRRRRERLAAQKAARIASVQMAVHGKLTVEIAQISTEAIANAGAETEAAEAIAARARALQRGVDLVLLDGYDAFGPALSTTAHATRVGAMLAHSATNITLSTGSLEHPDRAGDIRHGLGLSRT